MPAQHAARSRSEIIHYSGRNQAGAEDPTRARNVHGYRSYALNLVDNDLHTYWVARSSTHPANTDERTILPADFARLGQRLLRLPISTVAADAAGFAACLESIYHAGAIPVVDIRADDSLSLRTFFPFFLQHLLQPLFFASFQPAPFLHSLRFTALPLRALQFHI